MAHIPFIPTAYAGRSVNQESQRLINCYPELATAPGAKTIAALIGTPGLRLFTDGIASPTRGGVYFNGLLYVVESNALLSVNSSGQVTATLGTLQTSAGRVSMKHNGVKANGIGGDQICIVDWTAGYIYDTGTATFSTIALAGGFLANPKQVEFIDGYFIVTNGTMTAAASDLYDGTTWNALATTPVQAAPDNVQIPFNLHQQLMFIKEYTSEVYYNNQTPTSQGFPYSRIGGAVIDFGTPAPWSVARGDNSAFFVANQRNDDGGEYVGVVEMNGFNPQVISPQSITYTIGKSSDLSQLFGYCYSEDGHTFYVLTNPVDDWTFAYDSVTQMWHERSSSDTAGIHRHLSNIYINAFNMHLVGDYQSGRLFQMGSDFYTDAGRPIMTTIITQHLTDKQNLEDIFIGQLQADLEAGVGIDGPHKPATATTTIVGGVVTAVNLTYPGADYISLTDVYSQVFYNDGTPVLFSDGSPVLTPIVPGTIILRSVDGNGSGATATSVINHGSISQITVTNGGSGYTSPPEVIILAQPVTPIAALSWSKDGGHTWSNEYPKSMGDQGEYRKRLIWRSLGRSRDRVFKLRCSSPAKKVFLGFYVEAS